MDWTAEIKKSFKNANTLIKLIYINLALFIIIKLINVIYFLLGLQGSSVPSIINFLAVPAEPSSMLYKPWTIFTYMFLHEDFFHILFNMLWLFWFGKIFLQYLSQKQLLGIYILGGLAGAALYIIAFNVFPVFYEVKYVSHALGASAAVLAIVIATSVYVPEYTIHLLLIGPVKLKYIAIFSVIIDILSIAGNNSGGHIAHLGGAIFGYVFIKQYKKGKDLTSGINTIFSKIGGSFHPKRKIKVEYRKPTSDYDYNKKKASDQEEVNRILDKISKSGYESLSKIEKDTLFKMGNQKQ